MIEYTRPMTDEQKIDLTWGFCTGKMFCPRCIAKGRGGMHGELGLIADYVRGQGWQVVKVVRET